MGMTARPPPWRVVEGAGCFIADATEFCAFCREPLPIMNGQLQPWRAPSGLFFCNEFCADDAEEARLQSRGRADRKASKNPR
jgi:hypothetical protein